MHTFTALLGVSTIIGGSNPFHSAVIPSVLHILCIQSIMPTATNNKINVLLEFS